MKNIFTILLITAISATGFAQDNPTKWGMDDSKNLPKGLVVGDKAPKFQTKDVNGNPVVLDQLLSKGKVVVMFYRGQWCPVCSKHLSAFEEEVDQILAKGASVIAITPETTDNAKTMIENTGMTFTVIADTEGKIMKNYDVLFSVTDAYQKKINTYLKTDIAENNGSEEALLPVPATYIINQKGTIDHVFFDYNYKERASVSDIMKVL